MLPFLAKIKTKFLLRRIFYLFKTLSLAKQV